MRLQRTLHNNTLNVTIVSVPEKPKANDMKRNNTAMFIHLTLQKFCVASSACYLQYNHT